MFGGRGDFTNKHQTRPPTHEPCNRLPFRADVMSFSKRRQLKEATARCAKLEQQRSAAEVRANKAEADLDSVKSKGEVNGCWQEACGWVGRRGLCA